MNDHSRAMKLLARFFEGVLSASERAWLKGHLDRSEGSARELARYSEAERALEQRGAVDDPWTMGARERVEARLFGEPQPRRSKWAFPAIASMAVAAAASVAVFVLPSPNEDEFRSRGTVEPPVQLGLTVLQVLPGLELKPVSGVVASTSTLLFVASVSRPGFHQVVARWTNESGSESEATVVRGPAEDRGRLRLGSPIEVDQRWAGRKVAFRLEGPSGHGQWVELSFADE